MLGHVNERTFDSPAMFSIVVCGVLDARMSDWLGGLQITPLPDVGSLALTALVGELPDQSALFGVLNTLHNLAVPVLAMQRLASAPDSGATVIPH